MGTTDPRVDAYIAKSAEFARPILQHLRQVVHGACPDVEETIKWGMPNFMHGGKILADEGFDRPVLSLSKGSARTGKEKFSRDASISVLRSH